MQTCKITSLQHPAIKHFVKLRENKAYRGEKRRVLVTGVKLVEELSQLFSFTSLIVEENFSPAFSYKAENLYLVPPSVLKKVCGMPSAEPLAAEIVLPEEKLPSSLHSLLILDNLSDPGNLGTLLRSALALGWGGAFLTSNCTDPYNDKALRAAKGATFKLPWKRGSVQELIELLEERKFTLLGADVKGKNLLSLPPPKKQALILGNESHGIHPELKALATLVRIPMAPQMESLNVAAAGAILMFQLHNRSSHAR